MKSQRSLDHPPAGGGTFKWLAPIIISVLALTASAITAWYNFYSPFNAKADLTSMMWKMEELGTPDGLRVPSLVMVTEIHHLNTGVKPGRSESYEIVLERQADTKQWRFLPSVFITYGDFIRTLGSADREARQRIIESVLEGPFSPPFLHGGQSITRAVVFAPPTGFPVPADEIKRGDYLIHFRQFEGDEIERLRIVEFHVDRDNVAVIQEGKGLVIPLHRR